MPCNVMINLNLKALIYKFQPVYYSFVQGVMKDQLRIVADKIDKKARGVTNSLAAYEGIIPDAPTDSFRQKKGKGKVSAATARAASRVGKPRAGTVKGKKAGSMKKDKSRKQ